MSITEAIGGPLPPSWRLTTLGALCDESGGEVQTGPFGSQLHAGDYVAHGIPSVMPKDIVGDRISDRAIARVSEADAERLAQHRLQAGDIVYARRGDIGRRALVTEGEEGWLCGTGCLRIRLGKADLAPEYLLAYLGHPALRSWVESKAQGATMLNLNTSILRAVPLRVPPLPEQRRIANILHKADAIRRKRKDAIALTEDLLRSAFLEMFGDPVTNPKGWDCRPLGKAAELHAGNSLPAGEAFDGQPGGYLLLKVGDMNIPGNEVTISTAREWAASVPRAAVVAPPGAVVIPKRGGAIATNKKRVLSRPAALDPNLMAISPGHGVELSYLRQWFEGIDLSTLSNGSTVPQLNKKDLAPLRLPVPSKQDQARFASLAERVDGIAERHKRAAACADELFASLVARAFSGALHGEAPAC